VSQPQRDELRIEAESLGLFVCHSGEVLEAHEGNATAPNDQLTRVRGADTNHEHDIDVDIGLEQSGTAMLGIARQRDDIGALQHCAEITPVRVHRRVYDITKVRTFGIDDVIVPVCLEKTAVRGEVAVVGSGSVSAIENGKEIWQQVDQHLDQSAGRRRGGTMDAEMIVVARRWNKSNGQQRRA
jgi:hypothetical protein